MESQLENDCRNHIRRELYYERRAAAVRCIGSRSTTADCPDLRTREEFALWQRTAYRLAQLASAQWLTKVPRWRYLAADSINPSKEKLRA